MSKTTIDYALRTAWQTVQKMYNERAKAYGATMTQAFVLLSIDPKDGTPSTALGPLMGIEATSLSRTLKYMEEKGVIKKVAHPTDGRSVIIKLTKEGLKKRDESKKEVFHFNEVIEKNLSKAQLQNFFEVVEVIKNYANEQID
jgi:DNA-binding MarR family transcriptional regulator